MKKAYFRLSPDLLKVALHMPVDTEIKGVEWDFMTESIKVFVIHPDLPSVAEGDEVPMVAPTVTATRMFTSIGVNKSDMKVDYKWRWTI